MTLIEFFEHSVAENLCTSIVHPPDRVIFVGYQSNIDAYLDRYAKFFLERLGRELEFSYIRVPKNDIKGVLRAFEELAEKYDDCVFDITGGDDIYIFAAGVICEKYGSRVQMHYINVKNGEIYDFDRDGNFISMDMPLAFTVEDNVRLYGGKVVYARDTSREFGTPEWDMNEDFVKDIFKMWDVCREECRLWNQQITTLEYVEKAGSVSEDGLCVTAEKNEVQDMMLETDNGQAIFIKKLLDALKAAHVLTAVFDDDEGTVTIRFKNHQVRRCLTKSGQVLEMAVYAAALAAEKKSKKVYTDVRNGVSIDWDGVVHEQEARDAENEVDVVATHGMVPVFISCKNGLVKVDELYKLYSVAGKFGGKYAQKVLVAPALSRQGNAKQILERCAVLGIVVRCDLNKLNENDTVSYGMVHTLDRAGMTSMVGGLWSASAPLVRELK